MALILFVLLLVNFAFSYFNAKFTGKAWVESKHAGGWPRVMAWSGAVMAACGFTWCYLMILAFGAGALGYLDMQDIEALVNLGYLIIILPMVGSGFAITLNSWATAYRRRTLANTGIAGYNIFAQAYNTYNAVKTVPQALEKVMEYFFPKKGRRSSKNDAQAMLVLFLLIIAIGGGIITTWVIINREAANDEPLPVL